MSAVEDRMRAACELHDLTVALRRQALVRAHPGETSGQIDARLREWLLRTGLTGDGGAAAAPLR